MVGEQSVKEAREILHKHHIPMVVFPEVPGNVLGAMADYRDWLSKPRQSPFGYPSVKPEAVEQLLAKRNAQVLGEADTRPILSAYGFTPIAGGVAPDAVSAAKLAEKSGTLLRSKWFHPRFYINQMPVGLR